MPLVPLKFETGDARFKAQLDHLWELHQKKAADYGTDEDAFSNLRACERLGMEAYVGVIIRMADKLSRLERFVRDGTLACESVEDSFDDLAAYSLAAKILYRETL